MNTEIEQQLSLTMQKLMSGIEKLALEQKPLVPHARLIIGNAAPISDTIPDKCKSFNIINLGLDGLAVTFSFILVTGIVGLTEIPASIKVFGYSIENDQNYIVGPIVVTPSIDHHVIIQYLF